MIPSIETMGYISIPIFYENKEVKCDLHVIDTKQCNLFNGETALLLNILQLPKEKLKVNNVLNESNKHIQKVLTTLLITGHFHKYQTQLCISRKLKKKFYD